MLYDKTRAGNSILLALLDFGKKLTYNKTRNAKKESRHMETKKEEKVKTDEEFYVQIRSHMPAAETLKALADFFKVFGDSTRIRILYVLFQSEMCVGDLAQTLGLNQSAISHQLRVLKQMKLVTNRREGKIVYYALADSHIKTIINQGLEHISE